AATFLAEYGVGPGQVARVFRHYGDATVGLVKSNPFRLADDVKGIGFKTADRIARSLGIPRDAPERARAAVLYLLGEAGGQGHLLLPLDVLVRRVVALDVDEAAARSALEALAEEREVVVEDEPPAPPAAAPRVPDEDADGGDEPEIVPVDDGSASSVWDRRGPAVYSRRVHFEEDVVATLLAARAAKDGDPEQALRKVRWRAAGTGLELAPEQEEAVAAALTHRVAVVTGGPGVGKTTIVRLLVEEVVSRGADVSLAAPTGRAAKRLSEASGREASTVHRLLRFDPFSNRFTHHHDDPLPCDHLIVDECSMLDVPLASALLDALDDRARLTLVGDADQLPSVGPGDFFRAVCGAGTLPVTRLTKVFRQREGSRIVEGAHDVNRGVFPTFDPPGAGGEFYFVEKDDPSAVAEMIRALVCDRIPEVYGLDARVDVQTLTPMHKGASGAENLNAVLGAALNPTPAATLKRGERVLRTGDRVVQVRNDYDKGTFNGDQGFVVDIDERKRSAIVVIDGREVKYEGDDVGMLLPAWATTVHRAQGGEHKAVVLALTGQHFPLLRRNLVYTAITRARQLCVVVGSRRALERAIRTESTNDRYSWLEERLRAKGTGA
ncbi:MAG: AAA family ATPase, partial [Planctomycetota bacterium JB042]